MGQLFADAARAYLSAGIIAGDTTISITTGGGLFPTTVGPDFCKAVLQDATAIEIVYITAHASAANTFTVTRGQEGTTARSFAAGSVFGLRVTAADTAAFAGKLGDAPSDGKTYGRKDAAWVEAAATWSSIQSKPAVIAAGADQAAARAAVGAGTSNLALGTTAGTALAGNTSIQPPLVSGTNIKTINGSSVLGAGNLTVSGGVSLDHGHDNVGSYCLAKFQSGNSAFAPGDTVAGSTLMAVSISPTTDYDGSSNGFATLSGTWRIFGRTHSSPTGMTSLFQRIL